MSKYILALDQGTTSSRAILYNQAGDPIRTEQQEFSQIFPQPGWVEHDPLDIWSSQKTVMDKVIESLPAKGEIVGIGITNQRETTLVWDRVTGEPVYNAIVWQDRRTSELCNEMLSQGLEGKFSAKTGLIIDAYFSATKVKWILDNVEGVRTRAENGDLAFGTVDSWLVWNLTNGQSHITDVSNASRTMLFNIHSLEWDKEILEILDIPYSLLAEVRTSSEQYNTASLSNGMSVPIAGIAGDQQAALFGQMCINKEMAKCTYGTGCFLVMNTGNHPVQSNNRLLTTIGWKIGSELTYALEGSVFIGGAVIQWLRDGLEIINDSSESEDLSNSVNETDGVVFVPALTGLGAPHWDSSARGSIFGITRGTTRAHIARAALESITYQVDELLTAMSEDIGRPVAELRVDGGATANNLIMQMQSDISDVPVVRPSNLETTALGAAYLAGIAVGMWKIEELNKAWVEDKRFLSSVTSEIRQEKKNQWSKAVERSKGWVS